MQQFAVSTGLEHPQPQREEAAAVGVALDVPVALEEEAGWLVLVLVVLE